MMRPQRIITHPSNRQYVETIALELGAKYESRGLFGAFGWPLDILYNDSMEPSEPAGRVIEPDGSLVPYQGWTRQHDRFTTLTEDDLPWLVGLGVVAREMIPLFRLVAEPMIHFDYGIKLMQPRGLIVSTYA